MASAKKPKEEEKKKKKKSNSSAVKEIKKAIKKPEKKTSPTKTPTKSKPRPKPKSKPENNRSTKPKQKPKPYNNKSKKKSSNGTLARVESKVIADPSSSSESEQQENGKKAIKNVKPNNRKQKEKVVEENEEEEEEGGGEAEATMCRFPMSRIKRIMKSEDSRIALSQDVVFLVNKATEKFLEKFCEDGYRASVKDRKKSLSYKHLSTVVQERRRYDFLSDYVPDKIKAEDALKERNLTETGTG